MFNDADIYMLGFIAVMAVAIRIFKIWIEDAEYRNLRKLEKLSKSDPKSAFVGWAVGEHLQAEKEGRPSSTLPIIKAARLYGDRPQADVESES